MNCRDCSGATDHCHGTLIVHSTFVVECTDDSCAELQVVRHDLVVDCSAVAGGCTCADASDMARLAS